MPRHLFLVALSIILVTGCGDSAPAENPAAAQAAENARAIAELRTSLDELSDAVRRQDRQRAGLGRDVASLTRGQREAEGTDTERPSDPPPPEPGADLGVAGVDGGGPTDEGTVRALLETAAGREAIEKAAARESARREAEDRRTFVSYTVGMFAQRAGLDDRETGALQRIWKESLDAGADLRKRFAAVGQLPEAERPAAREEAMEFMRGIGRERNEKVQALLSAEQYELYADTEEEILGAVHGGPRRSTTRPTESGSRGE